ncbi:MAG: hypothetical protein HYU64_01655 [Armatimonadetes bacterium]|nr:hypothetical protein [Armatimonadota bacterium]
MRIRTSHHPDWIILEWADFSIVCRDSIIVKGGGLVATAAGGGALGMRLTLVGDLLGIYAQHKMTQ